MLEFFFFGDLTCGMCYRLGLDLKSFTGTAFRQQIFYRNGVPDRSGLLSPLRITFRKVGAKQKPKRNVISHYMLLTE